MLIYCTDCTAARPPDMTVCPHCRATDYTEENPAMAKGTRLNGPSNANDPTPDAEVAVPAGIDVEALAAEVDTPERPAGNAATDVWEAYVVALGGDPAEGATRAELMVMADELTSDPDTPPGDDDE